MGKIIVNQYLITNPKIASDKKFAYASDFHSDKLEETVQTLKRLGVVAVFFGGDIFDSTKDYKAKAKFKELVQELSKVMKVYIGFGNHEFLSYIKALDGARSEVKSNDIKYWNEISSMHNVYVSELPVEEATVTKWYFDKDIDITALNFPIDYYLNKRFFRTIRSNERFYY